MPNPSALNDTTEFIKALVRPFLIVSSWLAIILMWMNQVEPPPLLQGMASAIAGEYIIERAIKRLRE